VEHRGQLPVPEPGGRVPRAEVDGPQHNPHVGHPVADAVVPVRAGHPVPDRAGGQPRDQARPVLGDVGEQRADRGRPERPVPEHQHVRFPGRDGTGAEGRVRERAVRRAVLHAVVRADGETVRAVAGHRAAERAEPDQGGHVRTPAGRPAGRADGQVLRRHTQRVRRRLRRRPVRGVVPGCLPRQDQRGTGLLRQQRPGGGGRE